MRGQNMNTALRLADYDRNEYVDELQQMKFRAKNRNSNMLHCSVAAVDLI